MFIDLSHTFTDNMPVYPGDKTTQLTQVACIEKNKHSNFYLQSSLHVGTHVDAPAHMILHGKKINELPLENFQGKGYVIDARSYNIIDDSILQNKTIEPHSIVLFYTGYDQYYGQEKYFKTYPRITPELAQALLDKKIKMIGLDTPSPDYYPFPIHKLLFQHNIPIIENLTNLENLLPYSEFQLFAFPIKFTADASLVRVVAYIKETKT